MRRRIANLLLLAGSAALVWCLTVLAGAALFQWYEGRRIARMPNVEHAAPLHPANVHPTKRKPHPIPSLHEVIGRLDIPRLHVSTIVLEGDDSHALRLGAGHVPGTAYPFQTGNFSVAAHRDTFFRPLRKIKPSDVIELTTPDGLYTYQVQSTEIVNPQATRVMDSHGNGQELTLITCYPFYYVGPAPMRFIVHARRVS
jgi:sortase A